MDHAIEIISLTKKFGRRTVVNDLNLQVPYGRVYSLLGPNGAGKTTTVRMLMNIFQPSRGAARIFGVDSEKLGPKEFARIGYVSENQELPEWMTGEEFLRFCRTMYSTWDDHFCISLQKLFKH